jgi:hypothetical protein
MKDSIENLKIEDHDIMIIGDIDEIVSYKGLEYVKNCASYKHSPIYYK